MIRSLAPFCAIALTGTLLVSATQAANDIWDNNPGGNWENGLNWVDNSTPGTGDTATFNLGLAMPVSFGVAPTAIQNLTVSAGTVTFQSAGGTARTLNVNAAGGGNDLNMNGASTVLNLNSAAGVVTDALNLTIGDDLSVQGGATLNVNAGSDVIASDLSAAGLNGTIRIDGNGSTLSLNGLASHLVANTGNGSLIVQNGSVGSNITGALRIADGGTGVTGDVSITGGSSLSFGGVLSLASQNVVGQNATLNIHGTGSMLTQSLLPSPITVGSAANGTAAINIGVAATGGTFTTGTGVLTINKTGTVTLGSGASNAGTLVAAGDIVINGGVLQRNNAGSALTWAAGKTMTISNAGRATFFKGHTTPANSTYNLSGTGSLLESPTDDEKLAIENGAQVNVNSGADITSGNRFTIGTSGNGSLTVDGVGSTVIASGPSSNLFGGAGNAATLTLSNGASGSFTGTMELVVDPTAGSAATVNVLSDADLAIANLSIGSQNAIGPISAVLNVNGTGSTVTQSGASSLFVGNGPNNVASLNIGTAADGGNFTTGTGTMTIGQAGVVTIGTGANDGTLNANGNIVINGGVLQRLTGPSTFTWASGKTMTIQNGGRFTISNGSQAMASSATVNITGANSKLEITTGAHVLNIPSGAQVHVTAGGSIQTQAGISISGVLTVDGAGSSVTSGLTSNHDWPSGSATANVTFSNNATGNFGNLLLAHFVNPGTTATVTVQSGADVSARMIQLAINGGATTSGTLNVTGAGSSVTITNSSSTLTIGNASTGSAVVNLLDGGLFTASNAGVVINATGTLNIDGGIADLKTLNQNGGSINFASGSLSYLGNLTVGIGGLLGSNLSLDSNRTLTLSGTTTIDAARILSLDGGTFSTGSLVVNGAFEFDAGTLNVTGAGGFTIGSGGPLGNALTLGAGREINVTNTATIDSGAILSIESGGVFTAGTIANSGTVALNGPTVIVGGTTFNNSGVLRGEGVVTTALVNNAGGDIRAESGKLLKFQGATNTNNGRINLMGGTAEFVQPLTNGANGQIIGHGFLIAGGTGLNNQGQLLFSNDATSIFGDVNNNTGTAAKGIVITGNADVTFWDDVTNTGVSLFKVATGSSATFFGSYGGTGATGDGDLHFEGDLTPGSSPASVTFNNNVFFGPNSTTKIEIGGITAGSGYDQVHVTGEFSLDGALQVLLIGGFNPSAGQSFDIFDFNLANLTGTFSSIALPSLSGGLTWNTSQLYVSGVISVAAALHAGDFDGDGDVDGADFVAWQTNFPKASGATLDQGDADGDGDVDGADFVVWQTNFPFTPGPAVVPVPEAAAWILALTAFGVVGHWRRMNGGDGRVR